MLWFRPLDDSTEGFQNWEFMTTHCWGEQAAGEWTLKIKDTPSQKRDGAELGPLHLSVTFQRFETHTAVQLVWQLKYSAGLPGQTSHPALTLIFCHRDAAGVVPGDLRHRGAAISRSSCASPIGRDADGQ